MSLHSSSQPYFQPFHWDFEVSSKCTLKCPRCPRNEGLSHMTERMNQELNLEDFQNIFDSPIIPTPVRITFCGDIGDPIYAKDFIPIIKYIKSTFPSCLIYIITNGSYREDDWWRELAHHLTESDTIAFSIDGYDQKTNDLYRVNSDFSGIIKAAQIIRNNSEVFMVWATIAFAFNEDKIEKIKDLAKNYKFDEFQLTKSIKFGSHFDHYANEEGLDLLQPSNQYISQSGKYERTSTLLSKRKRQVDSYFHEIKRAYEKSLSQYKNSDLLPMCMVGNRGLFVSADGQLWPCSWVCFPYKEIASPSRPDKKLLYHESFFNKHKSAFNIKKRSAQSVLCDPLWEDLFEQFNNPEKKFIECEKKCSKKKLDRNFVFNFNTN